MWISYLPIFAPISNHYSWLLHILQSLLIWIENTCYYLLKLYKALIECATNPKGNSSRRSLVNSPLLMLLLYYAYKSAVLLKIDNKANKFHAFMARCKYVEIILFEPVCKQLFKSTCCLCALCVALCYSTGKAPKNSHWRKGQVDRKRGQIEELTRWDNLTSDRRPPATWAIFPAQKTRTNNGLLELKHWSIAKKKSTQKKCLIEDSTH